MTSARDRTGLLHVVTDPDGSSASATTTPNASQMRAERRELCAQSSHAPPGTGLGIWTGLWESGGLYQKVHSVIFFFLASAVGVLDMGSQWFRRRVLGQDVPASTATAQDVPASTTTAEEQRGGWARKHHGSDDPVVSAVELTPAGADKLHTE